MKKIWQRSILAICAILFMGMIIKQNADALTGEVLIVGTAAPGQTLTAYLVNSDYSGSVTYQWDFPFDPITVGMDRYKQQSYTLQSYDAGKFIRCVVTTPNGQIASKTVKVSDGGSGTGTTEYPQISAGYTGNGVLITWTGNATVGYQVLRNEVGNPIQKKIAPTGGTLDSCLAPSVKSFVDTKAEVGKTYEYQVVAYNPERESAKVTVTVGNSSTPTPTPTPTPTVQPLSITQHPWNRTVDAGTYIEYWCNANGNNLSYKWQGSMDGNNWTEYRSIEDPGTGHFKILATDAMNGLKIRFIVSNGSQSLTSNVATVTVKPEEKVEGSNATQSKNGVGLDVYANGSVGLNYFAYITTDETYQGRTLAVTLNGNKTTYPISQLSSYQTVKNANGSVTGYFYKITAELSAKQMADKVTFEVLNNNGAVLKSDVYSVTDYAALLLADSKNSTYHSLVKAMLNYGAAAQSYFGYNTGNLANSILSAADRTLAVLPQSLGSRSVNVQNTANFTGLTYAGASLVLDDETELRLYFKPAANVSSGYSATANSNGSQYSPDVKQKGEYYYVSIPDIDRAGMKNTFTVTVNQQSTGGTMTVTYQPMNYIEETVKTSSDTNLKNLLKALYWFIQK